MYVQRGHCQRYSRVLNETFGTDPNSDAADLKMRPTTLHSVMTSYCSSFHLPEVGGGNAAKGKHEPYSSFKLRFCIIMNKSEGTVPCPLLNA